MSIRKYCREVYFPTHESELVSLNIKSPRTLENSCCKNHKPNKHRSAFSNRAYLNPAYPDSFKQTISDIHYDLEHARRSLGKQKKWKTTLPRHRGCPLNAEHIREQMTKGADKYRNVSESIDVSRDMQIKTVYAVIKSSWMFLIGSLPHLPR